MTILREKPPGAITVSEAADRLGVQPATVRQLLAHDPPRLQPAGYYLPPDATWGQPARLVTEASVMARIAHGRTHRGRAPLSFPATPAT